MVNVKYSGVCHTDLHAVNGDWPIPTKLPLVGGHEGAGVVVAKGELVQDVEIGDHAGIKVKPIRYRMSYLEADMQRHTVVERLMFDL